MNEDKEEQERPMVSLVWLLKQPRHLEVATLKPVVEEAWGLEFDTEEIDAEELGDEGPFANESFNSTIDNLLSPKEPDAADDEEDDEDNDDDDDEDDPEASGNLIVGAAPVFMIHVEDRMFNLNSIPSPYLENPEEVADSVPDSRIRKILLEHTAWISVDYMFSLAEAPNDVADRDAAYERISRLMAELANEDCLALFCPETEQMVPYSPEMVERLQQSDPLDVFDEFAELPVVNVADDDPRMAAAVADARVRWPEFLAAFQKRYPGQQFAVKAPITSQDSTEFIWVEVNGIGGSTVFGVLANDPVDLPGMKFGDRVEIDFVDINDWLFTDGEEVTGLFTANALKEIVEEQEPD